MGFRPEHAVPDPGIGRARMPAMTATEIRCNARTGAGAAFAPPEARHAASECVGSASAGVTSYTLGDIRFAAVDSGPDSTLG